MQQAPPLTLGTPPHPGLITGPLWPPIVNVQPRGLLCGNTETVAVPLCSSLPHVEGCRDKSRKKAAPPTFYSTAYTLVRRTTLDTRVWGRLQRLHCAYGACPRGPSTLSLHGSHRLNLGLNKARLLDECSWNYRRPPDCVIEGSPPWHRTALLDD